MSVIFDLLINDSVKKTVVSSFSPTDIAGLELWLDSSDASTLTLDGVDVDNWADKSGQGNDISQSTAAEKPHTGGDIGGLNAVTFDGVDDVLSRGAVLTGTKGVAFFLVENTDASGGIPWSQSDASSDTDYMRSSSGNPSAGVLFDVTTIGSNSVGGDDFTPIGKPTLITVISDGTTWSMKKDGVAQSLFVHGFNTGDWAGDLSSADTFSVGGHVRLSGLVPFDGLVGEIAIYDNVDLTPEEITQMETYLMDKWIPIPERVEGLGLWFDADDADTLLLDTTKVSAWYDKSPNQYDTAQPLAFRKPSYVLDIQNGKPGIKFLGGATDTLNHEKAGLADIFSSTKGTFYAVAKPINNASFQGIIQFRDIAITAQHQLLLNHSTGTDSHLEILSDRRGDAEATIDLIKTTEANSVDAHIYKFKSSGSAYSFEVDGVAQTPSIVLGSNSGAWFDNYSVAMDYMAIGYATIGYMHEIIYYDNVDVSAEDEAIIMAYLADKWGITI